MTRALSGGQRSALEKLVQSARRWIENDLERTLEGKFGINADGRIETVERLSLSNAEAAVRADLVEIVEYLRSEGEDDRGSVDRLVREAAFTHTNRIIAVRVAEAIGLVPETMAHGITSTGFKDFSELAPTLATTEWGRFAEFVRLCADELAADVPALFDPRNPLIELEMSETVLSKIVEGIGRLSADVWAAPDTLGWAYQFFNAAEERRSARYREDGSSKPPETSQELAVRNQFFTPGYVVDFLVQNGLGEYLAAGFPALADELPLLVEVRTKQFDIGLDAVSVIDPACGSGHFLLGAYDLLEKAWGYAGFTPKESAPSIVQSLWGIDIDPRATQIAQAAVMFRARRHCRDQQLPIPNVICARSLPTGPDVDDLIRSLPKEVGRIVRSIANNLQDAPILGPLLKIEKQLAVDVRDVFDTGSVDGTLAEVVSDVTEIEAAVLDALAAVADAATSSAVQRLFVAEAHDAVRFVEAMSRRYSFALANPPFGQGCAATDDYLKSVYPGSWTELYACFVERCLELADHGTGAITSSTFLTTKRLRSYREGLANEGLAIVVDLGSGVLHGATVNTTAIVVKDTDACRYLDLRNEPFKDELLLRAVQVHSFAVHDLGVFARLPNTPFAFHASRSVVDMWESGTTLDPAIAMVRTGGKTFDNFRYIRAWWELSSDSLERGWIWYEKGGDYQPYFAPTPLMINWKRDGAELRDYGESFGRLAQVLQSSSYWGQSGICYPRMSSVGFSARLMPAGEIFADTSIAVLPHDELQTTAILGYLNSTAVAEILGVFGRGRSTENDSVKSLPIDPSWMADADLNRITMSLVTLFKELEATRETSPAFTARVDPGSLNRLVDLAEEVVEAQADLDRCVVNLLGMKERIDPTIPDRSGLNRALFVDESLDSSENRLVSFLVGVCMGRWSAELGQLGQGIANDLETAAWPFAPATVSLESASVLFLLDQPGHRLDLTDRLEKLRGSFPSASDGNDVDTHKGVAGRSFLRYMRLRFFEDHLKRYSRGGRKAPIYWPLQVPSRSWGIWVYAPRLSRETLFGIQREAEQRERFAEQQIKHLQREAESGEGRKASVVASELEAERRLAIELATFRAESERIANLGWEPNLDDGMVLNAAPLADLFPAWKDARSYRNELRGGKYEWATVARYADQL